LRGLGVEQRPAGLRRNRAARLLQRHRLQQHRSLLGLEPVDNVAARQGMGRIGSVLCVHPAGTVVPFSQREHPMCHRCATARLPLLSCQQNLSSFPTVRLLVQSAAQGEHPPVGIVQLVGSPIAGVQVTRAAGGAALAALAWFGIRINAWYGGALGRASIPHKGSGQSAAGVFSSSPRNGKDRPALRTPLRLRDERPEHPNRSYQSAHPSIRTSHRPHGELLHLNLRLSAPVLP
jgi:hypothetical protein